jgi:hypothetical protein
MNYFNYFTEVEEEFVKRRGSHLLVSPLDWSLIEMWKRRGIPLHIVLRGINSSFDGYDRRLSRGRKINSLFFCQQEVEALFQEYVESRVGAVRDGETGAAQNGGEDSRFSPSSVLDFLQERREALRKLEAKFPDAVLKETFARTSERLSQIVADLEQDKERGMGASLETLETDLMMIEEVILDGLKEHAGEGNLKQLRKEGNDRLRSYKQSMEREVYEQTVGTYVAQRLRDQYQIPRLSLFYL